MEVKRDFSGISITVELTLAEIEAAYRERSRFYETENALIHMKKFAGIWPQELEERGINIETWVENREFAQGCVEFYNDNHEVGISNEDQWYVAICAELNIPCLI